MRISTMPTIFESAEQSASSEYSDELITALAARQWWAIMDISHPISEEAVYGDLISGQCWGTVEAGDTGPTSLVYDASEKAQSHQSDFSDGTLKTTTWRQKRTQGAPVPSRSTQGGSTQGAPVPSRSTQGAHVPSRPTQGAPVPARSKQGAPVPARSKQGAPVPARSKQGAPVPARSKQGAPVPARSKQGASVTSRSTQGAPVPDRSKQAAPVPSRSTQGAPVPARSKQGAPVPSRSKQGAPVIARSKQGAPVSDRSTQGECLLIRSQQNSASSKKGDHPSSLVYNDASEKAQLSGFSYATLKSPDQRREGRQKKPQMAPVPADSPQEPPVPNRSQRGNLKIPDHLTKHLQKASFEMSKPVKSLERKPVAASKVLACSPYGAPMPDKNADRQKLKIPEALRQEVLQQKPQAFQQGTRMPDKNADRRKPKIPEPLRQEVLQQKPQAFQQGTRFPDKISQRQNISKLLRREQLQQNPLAPTLKIAQVCSQGAPVIDKISDWNSLKNPELPRQHLQNAPVLVSPASLRIPRQQREKWEQQQKISKGVPANTPQRMHAPPCSPQQPLGSPQGAPMPSWSKRVCPWSTEASDNSGLFQAPSQKLRVEIDKKVKQNLKLSSYNHQAHQATTSQLKQRTQRSPQPRSQLTRKKALDNAGVDLHKISSVCQSKSRTNSRIQAA